MIFIITSLDGGIHFRVDAAGQGEALQALAAHYDYGSFQALCDDLGYTGPELSIASLTDERRSTSYYLRLEKENLFEQQARLERGAFKFLRRLANA